MEWDVFICHASEDRKDVARPLAEKLEGLGLRVWLVDRFQNSVAFGRRCIHARGVALLAPYHQYASVARLAGVAHRRPRCGHYFGIDPLDENELRLGDSLVDKINQGIARSKIGVVILSKSFFSKGWTQRELNALCSIETRERKVILPHHDCLTLFDVGWAGGVRSSGLSVRDQRAGCCVADLRAGGIDAAAADEGAAGDPSACVAPGARQSIVFGVVPCHDDVSYQGVPGKPKPNWFSHILPLLASRGKHSPEARQRALPIPTAAPAPEPIRPLRRTIRARWCLPLRGRLGAQPTLSATVNQDRSDSP